MNSAIVDAPTNPGGTIWTTTSPFWNR
jgi:hypothetical protein